MAEDKFIMNSPSLGGEIFIFLDMYRPYVSSPTALSAPVVFVVVVILPEAFEPFGPVSAYVAEEQIGPDFLYLKHFLFSKQYIPGHKLLTVTLAQVWSLDHFSCEINFHGRTA